MKRVYAEKRVKIELLHEELEAALQEFFGLVYKEGKVTALVGDAESERTVLGVIAQHDPEGLTIRETAAAAESAAEVEEVLAAEKVIQESVDPVAILEARITRLETYIRQLQK